MIFTSDSFMRIAIAVLGLCGFFVARHIYKHKKPNANPLICPARFDCQAVVHSDYSTLMGVSVEVFGMIYYAILTIAYLVFIFVSDMPFMLVNFLIGMSLAAFLFSLYLLSIQAFVLKKGCLWCILSACISALIFVLTIATYHWSYIIGIFH